MKISSRAAAIHPSPTLAIAARAKALKAAGVDLVSLGAGEPELDTPQHVKLAAIAAIEAGFTRYTATTGIPELKQAIVAKLARENGLAYEEAEVIVTVGAKHALYNALQALVDPGDEVVIVAPYWVSYPDMIRLAGGAPVIVPTRAEDGFVPRPEALAGALTQRTAAVILNSPSNPTGAVFSGEVLRGIARVLEKHSCAVITDDIYEHLVYTGEPFQNVLNVAPGLKPRTLVVNGLSKSFSMTGWRVGYAAGPRDWISAMARIQDQSTSNASSISQKAALAALTGPLDFVLGMRAEYDRRRKLVKARLDAIPGVRCAPIAGAFYAFADFSELCSRSFKGEPLGGSSARLAQVLLDEFKVAVVPGEPFGAEGFIRLSFATSTEQLEKGLARIAACAAALE